MATILLPHDCFQCPNEIDPRWAVRIRTETGDTGCMHIDRLAKLGEKGKPPFKFSARDQKRLLAFHGRYNVEKTRRPELEDIQEIIFEGETRTRKRRRGPRKISAAARQQLEEEEKEREEKESALLDELKKEQLFLESEKRAEIAEFPRIWIDEKCEEDPILYMDIPKERQIRLRIRGRLLCYDVETLYKSLQEANLEPTTRVPFSESQLRRITRKYREVEGLSDEEAPALKIEQKRVSVVQAGELSEQMAEILEEAEVIRQRERDAAMARMLARGISPDEANRVILELIERGATAEEVQEAVARFQ